MLAALFIQAGNFDEALAAYREAEQSWQRVLAEDSSQDYAKKEIAGLHARIGDLYALSPNDSADLKQRNRTRLQTACGWY